MSHHFSHYLVTGATVTGLLLTTLVAPPAHAQPPPNDDISSATRVTSIPSSFEQDISEATTGRGDGRCVERQSIWYRYRPTTTQEEVRISTVGSSYDTQLAVFSGPRDRRTLVECNDDRAEQASVVRTDFVAGKRYWIAVSRDDRRSAPGQAALHLYAATVPELSVTVDSVAAGEVSGRFFISGTATCNLPSYLWTRVEVSQRVGEDVARARYYADGALCDTDAATQWRFSLDSETVKAFQPGRAVVSVTVRADAGVDHASWKLPATVFDVGVDPG